MKFIDYLFSWESILTFIIDTNPVILKLYTGVDIPAFSGF